uniref:Cytochrome P450 71A1-like n=1 Tax=Nelumbo nucifera TaxID=4432 RepID=A0A823A054_NELNU|nr:TPA_asm: hypothetical protein HUJ06_018656 [Nelumbo nucifera]
MSMEIAKTQDTNFATRPSTTAAKKLLYGCNDLGFAPYSEYWRQMKKMSVLRLLSVKRVQSFRFIREQEVALLIEKISRACQLRNSINLIELLTILSNYLISRAAFSRKFEEEDDDSRRIGPLTMERTSQELDKLLDQVIRGHVSTIDDQRSKDQRDGEDFLDILLQAQKDSTLDIPITRDNIKAISLDMFIGGSDTTAITVEWSMTELVKNPKVMRKAHEVRRVVGKKSKFEEDDIPQMAYLKVVIKETLRLHPPAPFFIPRESIRAINVNGYHIPAKTNLHRCLGNSKSG